MFIPIGTDAPIYYRPYGTIGLIVANLVTFVLTAGGWEDSGWLLRYGDGLHPTEWIASAFLHFGVLHLIGNMIFLWTFGLIVEGKLGWWRFLLLYFGLCTLDGAVSQTLMLGYDGPAEGAGGASGVIYALMAIALVWAPANDIDVLLFFGIGFWLRIARFEISVLFFALFYIVLDLVFAWLGDFHPSSELLHLLGAAVGFPVGAIMVKAGLVDCEGWDVFSCWQREKVQLFGDHPGRRGSARSQSGAHHDHPPPIQRRVSPKQELERVGRLIDEGKTFAASQRYRTLRERTGRVGLDAARLHRLIDSLHGQQDWEGLVPLLEEFIERFPEKAASARLMLAAILLREQGRPRAALKTVEPIDPTELATEQRGLLERLQRAAERQIADGVLELSG